MARIVISEFMDERAVAQLRARHEVLYDPKLVDDGPRLATALKSGHLGGAAIDVFGTEPLPAAPHFEGCPNLVLTPHIAGVTAEANERVSFLIAQKVGEVLAAAEAGEGGGAR